MKKIILGLCLVLMMPLFLLAHINFWQKLFTEPVETIYIIMKDGTPFRYSSQNEIKIYMKIDELEKNLKTPEKSYKIKDIAIIIHNHFINDEFTIDDRKQWRDLKKHGFDGLFLMYCHRTNKTYCFEEK